MAQQTTDSLGNIIDLTTGRQIGVVPGSVADIGSASKIKPTLPTTAGSSTGTLPALPTLPSLSDLYSKGQQIGSAIGNAATAAGSAIASVASGAGAPVARWFGISLEDVVFIVLGLILIAAAALSFKPVQEAAKTAAKTAVEAAA